MYLLLNHLKEGSPSTEEDDPSTVFLSETVCFGRCPQIPMLQALTETENRSVNAP